MYITKISVSNGTDGAELTVDSSRTLRSVLDEAGLNYSRGLLQYNGTILSNSCLDSTIEDVTDDPNQKQILRITVKAENAVDEACAVVNGAAMVITSSATPEQLKTLKKYRPHALKLYDGEGSNKKEVFMVNVTGDGDGCINQYGAVFSERTNQAGKATITMMIPEDVTDVKEWAADTLGVSILHLRKVEQQFAEVLDEVQAEKAAVNEAIVVA